VRISSPNSSDGRAAAGETVLEIDAAERKQRERESVAAGVVRRTASVRAESASER